MTQSQYNGKLTKFFIFACIKIVIAIACAMTLFLTPVSIMLIMNIFRQYKFLSIAKTNINYFNENNDGIYHHFLADGSCKYEIRIDDNEKTIYLASGNKEKLYSYNDITEWSYNIGSQSSTSNTTTVVAGGGVAGAMAGTFAAAQKLGEINRGNAQAWKNNGFFIKTNDIQNPVWQIKFCHEDVLDIGEAYWDGVIPQCQSWMLVFNRVLNS